MQKRITVAVLAGGSSAEKAVSLESGKAVAAALKKRGFNVLRFDPAKDLTKFIQAKNKIDIVFPALHGRGGEDGSIQGLLEFLGLRYVGSRMPGMIVSFDKVAAKGIFRMNKLPVIRDYVASQFDLDSAEKAWKRIGRPAFVKPAIEGSSFGASIVNKKLDLIPALRKAWKFGPTALVEEYIRGTEVSVGVLQTPGGLQALPPIEICSKRKFFDLKAKYNPKFCREIIPARLSPTLTMKVQILARQAHYVLGLKDFSRTDMLIRQNRIYLLETNTIPGLTPVSLYPQEAAAAGIDFPELCKRLIDLNIPGK